MIKGTNSTKNPMNVYNEGSNRGTPKEQLALKAA